MSTITITNIDSVPARKYGIDFAPGESKYINCDVIFAYSIMEISRYLHDLNKKTPTTVHQHFDFQPKGRVQVNAKLEKERSWFQKWREQRSLKKDGKTTE